MRRFAYGLMVCFGLLLAGGELVDAVLDVGQDLAGTAKASVAIGRPFYVIADSNCVQVDQDPNYVTFPYDKTKVVGHLIGAVDCYRKMKVNIPGQWCDPDNDPVVVTLAQSPAWLSLTTDPVNRTFMLAGEPSQMGVFYIVLALADIPPDGPPELVEATILLNVLPRPNKKPAVRIVSQSQE